MSVVPERARQVLDFWFGEPAGPGYGQPKQAWFRKSETFDAQIRRGFGAEVANALDGGYGEWESTSLGALALLLLLDQFPRNLFRGEARAYSGDARALALARRLVEGNHHRTLLPAQQVFVILPFEHSENLADQHTSVALFAELCAGAPAMAGFLDYAQKHREVIERFGRFPHRNAALKRPSTADEKAWLALPGSGF